jgi:maltooligosyltrehalose trehalohydrolase
MAASQATKERRAVTSPRSTRRYAHGAELSGDGASFRVWADRARSVDLLLGDDRELALAAEGGGWFSARAPSVAAGTSYAFRLDGSEPLADPASRAQLAGPDSWSVLVDPTAFRWKHTDWPGIAPHGQVLYELHVGTFTRRGTWAAAAERLPHLAALGVTVVEMMPVADFRGRFGWGYDGALSYAPTALYGTPDDLRAFVDAAHGHGIGVIVDVVYNHFGPGNRFAEFSEGWFTDRYQNEWGASLNFDGEGCEPVRDYVAENAAYWIAEFGLDGLRLDATQALFDASDEHILARIAREARAAAGSREILLVAENEPQHTRLVRPAEEGGYGLDTLWNDDFHHSAHVALTGRREAYYHDYRGAPQELVAAARFGNLFQGQRYDWQDAPRGTPGLALPPTAFVTFLENHDQIANSALGLRMHALADHARLKAMTALLLLSPQTPMLFQGQEFWASAPFHFFADQGPELDPMIAEGRADFLAQFASLRDPAARSRLPEPAAPATFERCQLDWSELDRHGHALALHRDLLRLRRETPAFAGSARVDGSVIAPEALLLRFFAAEPADQRLLLVNLGADLPVASVPDPLFAPPADYDWYRVWSSEDPAYGGGGARGIDTGRRFVLTADCAVVLAPGPRHVRSRTDDLDGWQELIG